MEPQQPSEGFLKGVFDKIKPFLTEQSIAFMETKIPHTLLEVDRESTYLHVCYFGMTFSVTYPLESASETVESLEIPTEHSLKKMGKMINKLVESGIIKGGAFLEEKVVMMKLGIISPAYRYMLLFYTGTETPNQQLKLKNIYITGEGELAPYFHNQNGIDMIYEERRMQMMALKYTPDKDQQYQNDELIRAAYCYMLSEEARQEGRNDNGDDIFTAGYWPWDKDLFRPHPEDRLKDLAKAGALIAAEIDRIIYKRQVDAGTNDTV